MQVIVQGGEVEQRPARFQVDEEVDIRTYRLLPAGDGAHHPHVVCAMALRDLADGVAALA